MCSVYSTRAFSTKRQPFLLDFTSNIPFLCITPNETHSTVDWETCPPISHPANSREYQSFMATLLCTVIKWNFICVLSIISSWTRETPSIRSRLLPLVQLNALELKGVPLGGQQSVPYCYSELHQRKKCEGGKPDPMSILPLVNIPMRPINPSRFNPNWTLLPFYVCCTCHPDTARPFFHCSFTSPK